MTEQQNEREQTGVSEASKEASRALETLIDIGRMWASHGLQIGKGALATSARTLEATAAHLDELSTRLEHKKQ
jgi:hypothetical protein